VAARPAGFQNAASIPSATEAYAPSSAEARAPAGTSRNAKPVGSAPAIRTTSARAIADATAPSLILGLVMDLRLSTGPPGPDEGRSYYQVHPTPMGERP